MGGPGQGQGGVAPEDGSETGFVPRRSRSALRAGRMLMQWKNTEGATEGEVARNYAETLQQVQQGASEAILQENVPPSYHGAVQRYFDRLPKGGAKTGDAKKGSPKESGRAGSGR